MNNEIDKKWFCNRLAQLRTQKGVSARDMSLSLGQSAGYINNIENEVNLPSMTIFFYICEFLEISPADFFNKHARVPGKTHELSDLAGELTDNQISLLISVAKEMRHQ